MHRTWVYLQEGQDGKIDREKKTMKSNVGASKRKKGESSLDRSFTHSDKAACEGPFFSFEIHLFSVFRTHPGLPPSVRRSLHSSFTLSSLCGVTGVFLFHLLIGISPGASSAMSVECEIWDASMFGRIGGIHVLPAAFMNA